MANHFLADETGSTQRPDMVSGLGILSFINCGFFLLLYGFGAMAMLGIRSVPEEEFISMLTAQADQFKAMMGEGAEAQLEEIGTMLYHSGAVLMFLLLVRTVARFIGAIGMWQGKRSGFNIYAGAQVVGIFLPHIVLPLKYLGFFGPMMALALVALYGTQRKRMG
ncbi:MAG: hypothetical protein KA352_05170 [Flavobacteriales bacterium]|nr:hypothetical protein [Flavobacteriales bacterium]